MVTITMIKGTEKIMTLQINRIKLKGIYTNTHAYTKITFAYPQHALFSYKRAVAITA